MTAIKTEFYRYGKTIVASYRTAGRLGAYSLAPSAKEFEPGLQMLAMIDFDRSGLAETITRKDFMEVARARAIELPIELKPHKRAKSVKSKKGQTKLRIIKATRA